MLLSLLYLVYAYDYIKILIVTITEMVDEFNFFIWIFPNFPDLFQ